MVARIVGTKSIRQTTEHFFNSWHGSGEEYDAWLQAREKSEGSTLGVPSKAEIVVGIHGDFRQEGDSVVFQGYWGKESDLKEQLDAPFKLEYTGKKDEKEGQNTENNPDSPSKGGLWSANDGEEETAEWPPSGLYRGSFANGGQSVPEEVTLRFTVDSIMKGNGSNSLAGKFGMQGMYTKKKEGSKFVATVTAKKWYLPQKKKGTLSSQRDLFYLHLWPALLKAGWHLQKGSRPNDNYFMPPHIKDRFMKGFRNRIDYFDSRSQVVSYVEFDEKWREEYAMYKSAAEEKGGDCQPGRSAYAAQFKVEKQKGPQLEPVWNETPPPSPGGHDSVCRKCRDGGDLIVCDACPASYHLLCVNPPIFDEDELPEGDWFCEQCVAKAEKKGVKPVAVDILESVLVSEPIVEAIVLD